MRKHNTTFSATHNFPVRIYYEDTDAAGIVYYANYLKFAERARTELLRITGVEQHDLLKEQSVGFVVRKCTAEFLKPARLDDMLAVETHLHDLGKFSISMVQKIRRGEEILVEMEVKLAVVGAGMKLVRLPEFIRDSMMKIFR